MKISLITISCNNPKELALTIKSVKKIAKEVDFQCIAQSSTGIRDGLIKSVIENIDSSRRWASRGHGRRIAKEVAKNMNFQVDEKLISPASVEWANNFYKK